jgi:hypothetical protein
LTDASIKCPYRHSEEYRFGKSDTHETIEDFNDTEKLVQDFPSADPLAEIDSGDGRIARPVFINANMKAD